jgi:hypothetical protein
LSGAAGEVTARNLIITANDKTMTYGTGNTLAGYATSGLQNGETIGSATLTTNATSSTSGNWNASATPWTITASGATGGTFNAANYNISYVDGALAIGKKTLTVLTAAADKVYDGLTGASVTFGDDRIASDVLTASATASTFADKNVGTAKTVTTTGIAITGTDAGNYTLSSTSATDNANITARNLTITANDKTMTYGAGNTFAGYATSGLQNGETIGSATLSTNATSSASGNWNANTTPWTITASGATGGTFAASNYTISYVDGALNIGKKAVTASLPSTTHTYGTLTPSYGAADVTWNSLVAGDSAADLDSVVFNLGGATAGVSDATGAYTLTLTSFNDNNYSMNVGTDVTAGLLTVATATAPAKDNDTTAPVIPVTPEPPAPPVVPDEPVTPPAPPVAPEPPHTTKDPVNKNDDVITRLSKLLDIKYSEIAWSEIDKEEQIKASNDNNVHYDQRCDGDSRSAGCMNQ